MPRVDRTGDAARLMLDRLRDLLGGDMVAAGREDQSVHGRQPRVAVSPGSAEEAAAVLRLCSEEGWCVQLAGGGTWLDAGRPLLGLDVLVRTDRMASLEAFHTADLTATVGAGLPLADLQSRLAASQQTLPLDPPARGRETVGGVVACAAAGPLRLAHGTPRDHVLGLEMVTGDGRVLALGGQVVKNVAGYDLVRAVTGSRGTLGLITRLHIRLRPLPEKDASVALACADPITLVDYGLVCSQRWEPAAVELAAPPLARRIFDTRDQWTLVLRFRGPDEVVDAALSWLRQSRPTRTAIQPDPRAYWDKAARLEAEDTYSFRVASLPSTLPHTLALGVAIAAGRPGGVHGNFRSDKSLWGVPGDWMIAAHGGSGIVRVWRPGRFPEPDPDRMARALGAAADAVREQDGSAFIVRGPDRFTERLPSGWEVPGPTLPLLEGLKRAFDPAGILSPGQVA